jgi:hypothetical protein
VSDLDEGKNVRGYMFSGKRRFIAVYVPEVHQIWTNPDCSSGEVNAALPECSPSEVLPLLNHLQATSQHPTHDDFRDIIEAIYYAAYPLAVRPDIDINDLPPIESRYSKLGIRILQLSVRLSDALKVISLKGKESYSEMVTLAESYESWLIGQCVDWVVRAHGIRDTITVTKQYLYI